MVAYDYQKDLKVAQTGILKKKSWKKNFTFFLKMWRFLKFRRDFLQDPSTEANDISCESNYI